MRILNVGNFDNKNAFRHFFGMPRKLSRGFTALGHAVVEFSDRDVARQVSRLGMRKLGVKAANELFVEAVRNVRPDLIVLGHADVILPDALAAAREIVPSVKICQWNYDSISGSDKSSSDNIRRISSKLDCVDLTLVSTAGPALRQLSRPGRAVRYVPNPVDSALEPLRGFAQPSHDFDLWYGMRGPAGTRKWMGRWMNGDEFAAHLKAILPGLRIAHPGLLGAPPTWGVAYQTLIASCLMGLALSQESDIPLYASDRMAHLLGLGVLVFIDRAAGFDSLFSDDELAFYGSEGEFVEKTRHYRDHPDQARAVAQAGWTRAHRDYSSTQVAAYIIEAAFHNQVTGSYSWPVDAY
jgi:hypothetical protein